MDRPIEQKIRFTGKESPNRLELEVRAPEDGFLVRLENFHYGWRAFVDGENTKIYRANYAFQAIKVPKGSHKVIFQFSTIYPYLFVLQFCCVFLAWIFFLAFLPQFADPGRGSLTLQIILLGFIFFLSTVLIFGSVALLAGTLGEWLNKSSKAQLVLNRVAGTVFIALALKLITTQR